VAKTNPARHALKRGSGPPARFDQLPPRTLKALRESFSNFSDAKKRATAFYYFLHKGLTNIYWAEHARFIGGHPESTIFYHDAFGDGKAPIPTPTGSLWYTTTAVVEYINMVCSNPIAVRGEDKISVAHKTVLAIARASGDSRFPEETWIGRLDHPPANLASRDTDKFALAISPVRTFVRPSNQRPWRNLTPAYIIGDGYAAVLGDELCVSDVVAATLELSALNDISDPETPQNEFVLYEIRDLWQTASERYDRCRGLSISPREFFYQDPPSTNQLGEALKLKNQAIRLAKNRLETPPSSVNRFPLPVEIWRQAWFLTKREAKNKRVENNVKFGIPRYSSIDEWAISSWGAEIISKTTLVR